MLLLRTTQRGLSLRDRLLETGTPLAFLADLCVELGFAAGRARNRTSRAGQLKIERVADGLEVDELRGEVGFAVRQMLDTRNGRLVVAAPLRRRAVRVMQPLSDAVAIGRGQ